MPDLKVMTFNILNGAPGDRFDHVCDRIRKMAPDVLVLQECLLWEEDDPRLQEVTAVLDIPVSPEHVLFGHAVKREDRPRHHVVARQVWQPARLRGDPQTRVLRMAGCAV